MYLSIEKTRSLYKALNKLEDTVIRKSNRNLEERMHAISEIRYYKPLLKSYYTLSEANQQELIVGVCASMEEIIKWLEQCD